MRRPAWARKLSPATSIAMAGLTSWSETSAVSPCCFPGSAANLSDSSGVGVRLCAFDIAKKLSSFACVDQQSILHVAAVGLRACRRDGLTGTRLLQCHLHIVGGLGNIRLIRGANAVDGAGIHQLALRIHD